MFFFYIPWKISRGYKKGTRGLSLNNYHHYILDPVLRQWSCSIPPEFITKPLFFRVFLLHMKKREHWLEMDYVNYLFWFKKISSLKDINSILNFSVFQKIIMIIKIKIEVRFCFHTFLWKLDRSSQSLFEASERSVKQKALWFFPLVRDWRIIKIKK